MLINQFTIDGAVIDGGQGTAPAGMLVTVVDCRNLICTITLPYNHYKALDITKWSLSLGGFVNTVSLISGTSYAVGTSRCLPGVTYTIASASDS
jgi:hypothetical protein